MKKLLFIGLILLLALAGCSSIKESAPVVVPVHDTLWQQYYEVDTVYTDRWHYIDRKGDTVWMHDSVIVYRAKYIHDTTRVVETVTVPVTLTKTEYVEKELSWWQRKLIHLGWVFIAASCVVLAIWGFKVWRRR